MVTPFTTGLGELAQWQGHKRSIFTSHLRGLSQLTSSTTTHIYIIGFGLVHPDVYPLYDLLKHVKGLVCGTVAAGSP